MTKMKNKTYIEEKTRLKEQLTEIERQLETTHKQRADEDAEWKPLTSKQKGVLGQYGQFLRTYLDFKICHTVSAHWTKQSNFWRKEDHKSYEARTTKFRRDAIYWTHLVNYAEQKKMIAGSSWEDKSLTQDELKVLRMYYDETREKAMKDAIRYMELHFPNEV